MIDEFHKGNVYISKKHSNKIFEALEDDNQEAIERLLEEDKAERLSAKDFSADFLRDLKSDFNILRKVQELWAKIGRDPKWEAFVKILNSQTQVKEREADYLHRVARDGCLSCRTNSQRGRAQGHPLHGAIPSEEARKDVIANFDANAFQPT